MRAWRVAVIALLLTLPACGGGSDSTKPPDPEPSSSASVQRPRFANEDAREEADPPEDVVEADADHPAPAVLGSDDRVVDALQSINDTGAGSATRPDVCAMIGAAALDTALGAPARPGIPIEDGDGCMWADADDDVRLWLAVWSTAAEPGAWASSLRDAGFADMAGVADAFVHDEYPDSQSITVLALRRGFEIEVSMSWRTPPAATTRTRAARGAIEEPANEVGR